MSAPPTANALAGLAPSLFGFDRFVLDEVRFELRAAGQVVPMEPQVFDLLRYMARNQDRVLTKSELLDAIWPERYVTEAALNSRVMSARKALGDDGRQQRYIKTVHGRGYRFVAPVTTSSPAVAATAALALSSTSTWNRPLPAPSTTFIGREDQLATIEDLLSGTGRPLVSIVGPGGIGKTRLAVAAASRLQGAGLQVVHVPLEAVTGGAQIPGAIAAAIGLKPSTPDTAAEVIRNLAAARLLLVLDNFEHVVEGAPFLSALVAAAPDVRLLVTSRVVLGLVEEWVFRLDGLRGGDGSCSGEAGQLFLERARQANAAAPAPSPDECRAVDQVVDLVDGMPLAIELAASLTPYLPYAEIAALLSRDATLLVSDQQNATPRHRSMRALLEESWARLEPAQLRTLQSLSVFDGPFSASAAAHVAGASLPLLRRLVDGSLIQPVDGRFNLHPLMRQYARERCGEQLEALRRRSAEYYCNFLASRSDAFNGRNQVGATSEVEAEFTNVAAAWRWAAANARIDLIDSAMYPLFCYLTFRARFFEADELASLAIQTVERAPGDLHADTLGGLLMHHFWILSRLGRGHETLAAFARAEALFAGSRTPRPGMAMDPLTAASVIQLGAGNYAGAAEAAIAALQGAREREDQPAIAFAAWLAGVGRLRQARLVCVEVEPGRFGYQPTPGEHPDPLDDAANFNSLAARLLESAGETWLRAYVEIERGLIAKSFGHEGDQHFRTACELRRAIGDPQGTASALIYLADSLVDEEHLQETAALQSEASELFARVGDATGLTEAERLAGRIAIIRGDFDLAAEHFARTVEMSTAIGFSNNVLSALRGMGTILQLTGRLVPAAVVHAFVAGHPAPTPFTRASAEFDVAQIDRLLGVGAADEARRQAATLDVASASAFAFEAFKAPPPGRSHPDEAPVASMVKPRHAGLVA